MSGFGRMKNAYLSYILFSSAIVFVLVKILLAFFMFILGFLETLVATHYCLFGHCLCSYSLKNNAGVYEI